MAEMQFALGELAAADASLATELEILGAMGGNSRQEAIAYTFRTHIARSRGDVVTAAHLEAQATMAASAASRGDQAFERRIHAYLRADHWQPMRM
jgi:hypothetical protein